MSMLVYAIGFLAQGFFSARMLVQWILSEKARRVLSPTVFWVLSIIGSYLLCIYGWLRHDFAIVLGQFISYYIYLWNLKEKGVWQRLHAALKALLLLTPVVAILWVAGDASAFVASFIRNEEVPLWLLLFGSGRTGGIHPAVHISIHIFPPGRPFGPSGGILDSQSRWFDVYSELRHPALGPRADCGPVVRTCGLFTQSLDRLPLGAQPKGQRLT